MSPAPPVSAPDTVLKKLSQKGLNVDFQAQVAGTVNWCCGNSNSCTGCPTKCLKNKNNKNII